MSLVRTHAPSQLKGRSKNIQRWNNINWNTPAQKLEAVQHLHSLSKEERDAILRDEATKVAPWNVTGRALRRWYTKFQKAECNPENVYFADLGRTAVLDDNAVTEIVRKVEENVQSKHGCNIGPKHMKRMIEEAVAHLAKQRKLKSHIVHKSTMNRVKAVLTAKGLPTSTTFTITTTTTTVSFTYQ